MTVRIIVVAAASLFALSGCGSSSCRVGGTVTMSGQPLSEGSLTLEPDGFAGPAAVVSIRDGRYEVGSDKALAPGHYLVRIGPAAWQGGQARPQEFPIYSTTADLSSGSSEVNFNIPAAHRK